MTTQTKYTPGPWRIAEDQWTIEGKNSGNCWVPIAKPYEENEQNRDANRNLICAAPDLLKACKAVKKLKGMTGDANIDNLIHKAIAKAEGN